MNSECQKEHAAQYSSNSTPRRYSLVLIVGGGLLLLLAISCGTLKKPLVVPPRIAGATFIGSQECAICHPEIARFFPTATHARLMARGTNALNIGCESCHGPGSLHDESGGAPHTIINPGRSPEVCFHCHLDKRGQFNLPYHHPVLEGKITCSDCHDLHRNTARRSGGTALLNEKDICIQCHTPQIGPFVFEHEAMREGCTTCHSVHGSVNAKLLKNRNANLCLRCHFQRQTTAGHIYIGTRDHTPFLSRGTCWSAGCHEAMHGSQVSTLLRF